jgi:uncharacterized LabA/DUF88 family protein
MEQNREGRAGLLGCERWEVGVDCDQRLCDCARLQVSGKGAADIAMVVDAMATLYTMPTVSCFVLATGDSDFSPLFKHLNQSGRTLVGVGPHRYAQRDFCDPKKSRMHAQRALYHP